MLSLPGYDTSGFKSIPQISSWATKHATFNFSPLRDRKRSLVGRAKQNAALPVSRIPTELLCDIFSKFLEDDREFPDYAPAMGPLVSLHTRADPTILGQVCSWWRSVALSTQALWANIFILEPKRPQISRTRMWLERAGAHPLNIAIEERRKTGYNLASLNDILSALASRRHLWRKVNFFIPSSAVEALMAAITNLHPDWQNLESASLCIEFLQPSQKTSIDAIWKAFHSSPVLHEVDWRGLYYNGLPTHAPWAQLTHLSLLSEFNAESLVDVLASCTKIRVLSICQLSLSSETTKSPEPIVLNSLHTLTLEAEVETAPLFKRLTLPSLRSFDMRYRYLDKNLSNDLVGFQALLMRSNCSLERFAYYHENIEEDHLHGYITCPHLRNVAVLELQAPISDRTIKSLTRQTNDGFHEIMPFLETMALSIRSSSDGLLAQMASSRWTDLDAHKGRKTLKEIILDKNGDYGIADELGLSKLFDTGLQGFKS
ncbi:hypothetical protein BYT27DRAFT_7338928 [Phlegmacium glaucopus]|nr:hypothetical protein BYT27DRAFT_7338928 [Phlegmacium glaucopus]